MSIKGSKTKTSYIEWDSMLNLIYRLQKNGKHRDALLIAFGCYTGLRMGDILALRWEQLLGADTLEIKENKTGKERKIKLNAELKPYIQSWHSHSPKQAPHCPVFPVTIQWVNKRLKEICTEYSIKTGNVSSHMLRKTFGRRVWDKDNQSERALLMLGEIFNHSSIKITKIYLGIRDQEIADVYDSL